MARNFQLLIRIMIKLPLAVVLHLFRGAFWYNTCHSTNPLGLYGNTNYGQGINWVPYTDHYVSLELIKFLIHPKKFTASKLCLIDSIKTTCIDCN